MSPAFIDSIAGNSGLLQTILRKLQSYLKELISIQEALIEHLTG